MLAIIVWIKKKRLGRKDEGEKVSVQVVPREGKSALKKCHIHIAEQQQNLLCLEANASFRPDQGSQTDPAVVAGASTGNNRFYPKQPPILYFSEDCVIM